MANIENHIDTSKKLLDIVRDHVDRQNYTSALDMLCNLMTENRELINHVFKLEVLKAGAARRAGEHSG